MLELVKLRSKEPVSFLCYGVFPIWFFIEEIEKFLFGSIIPFKEVTFKSFSPLKRLLMPKNVFMCLTNTSSIIQKLVLVFQFLGLFVLLDLLIKHYTERTLWHQFRNLVFDHLFISLLRIYLLFEVAFPVAVIAQFKVTLNFAINDLKFLRINQVLNFTAISQICFKIYVIETLILLNFNDRAHRDNLRLVFFHSSLC